MGKVNFTFKKIILVMFVLSTIIHVHAQEENVTTMPVEKLGIPIEDLIKDPLRDVPILSRDAIESAQSGIGSNSNPKESNLQTYTEKTETGEERTYLVWNITFGEPDNKEVLVDATNGKIISIKSVSRAYGIKNIYIISSIAIATLVILIVVFVIKKMRVKKENKSWEELKIQQ